MLLTALHASASPADHFDLRRIFRASRWHLQMASDMPDALARVRVQPVPVLVCARQLPGGDWQRLLEQVAELPRPPRLVVACRLADERLWAEVLNLGGFDLLSLPFEPREVRHVVSHAWNSWQQEWAPPPRKAAVAS